MKKTRIFFGGAIIILAAIGLVATKASTKFATYYYQENGKTCSVVTGLECGNGALNCVAIINGSAYTLFLFRTADGASCFGAAKRP